MDKNGEAIYGTRTTDYFSENNIYFTKGKGNNLYALVKINEGGSPAMTISWTKDIPKSGSKVTLLGEDISLKWEKKGEKVLVYLPKEIIEKYHSSPALALRFEK